MPHHNVIFFLHCSATLSHLNCKEIVVRQGVQFMKRGFAVIMMMYEVAYCTLIVFGCFGWCILLMMHFWWGYIHGVPKRVLSELLDLALIMGACLNPLCRTPHYLLWETPYTVHSIGYLYFWTKNSFAEMMFRSIYETKTNLLFSMLKD